MTDWRKRAACATEDPELFFPLGTSGPARLQADEAKAVCRYRCPVTEQCLQWALSTNQDAGVWGGLTEEERRKLRRRAARTTGRPAAPKRIEGPAYAVARTKGARILRLAEEGQQPGAIARALVLPIGVVRKAHQLVTSGAVEPNPEPETAGAHS